MDAAGLITFVGLDVYTEREQWAALVLSDANSTYISHTHDTHTIHIWVRVAIPTHFTRFSPFFGEFASVNRCIVLLDDDESSLLGLFHPEVQHGLFHHLNIFCTIDASFWHDNERAAFPPHEATPHHHSLSSGLEWWCEAGRIKMFWGFSPDMNLSRIFTNFEGWFIYL